MEIIVMKVTHRLRIHSHQHQQQQQKKNPTTFIGFILSVALVFAHASVLDLQLVRISTTFVLCEFLCIFTFRMYCVGFIVRVIIVTM